MEEEYASKIRQNLVLLKETLGKERSDLDKIIDLLIQKQIFPWNKKNDIIRAETNSMMMDLFLECLKARGPKAYGVFREALQSFGGHYEEVVIALDKTEVPVQSRQTKYNRHGTFPKKKALVEVDCDNAYEREHRDEELFESLGRKIDTNHQAGLVQIRELKVEVGRVGQKADENYQKLYDKTEAIQAEMSNLRTQMESQKEEKDEAKRIIIKKQKEFTDLSDKYNTLLKTNTDLKAQLSRRVEQTKQLTKQNEDLKKQLDKVKSEPQNDRALLSKYNSIKNDKTRLEIEISNLKKQVDKLDQDNKALQKDCAYFLKPYRTDRTSSIQKTGGPHSHCLK